MSIIIILFAENYGRSSSYNKKLPSPKKNILKNDLRPLYILLCE